MIFSNDRGSVIDSQTQEVFFNSWYEMFIELEKRNWLRDLSEANIHLSRRHWDINYGMKIARPIKTTL